MTRELAIGVVVRPHGLRGHLRVRSLSGEVAHFLKLTDVSLRRGDAERRYRVEEVSAAAGIVRLKLAGVEDVGVARGLVGWEVWVDREHGAPLGEREYYVADLCGCRVAGPRGDVGTVVSVLNAGAGDLLEIRGEKGMEVLIPFRDAFVAAVDVEGRTIMLVEDPGRL